MMWRVLCLLLWTGASFAQCSRELTMLERDVPSDTRWVDAIFHEAGCALKRLPNTERIIDRMWAIKTGRVDVLSAITPLPERAEYGWFSRPYDRERIVLLAHEAFAQRIRLNTLDDVALLKITVIGPQYGYYGPQWAAVREQLRQKNHLINYPNWRHGASVLLRNPNFLLLIPEDGGDEVIARSPHPLRKLSLIVYQTDVVLMFSRKTVSEADISVINSAIQRLQQRGFSP
jgi:polar amino acid transport system substrate-binding protein